MPAVESAAEYADWPKMLITSLGCKCPMCGKEWVLHGQGQGFVKAGAFKHIAACFEKKLAGRGLKVGKWNDEKQAHLLVPLNYVEPAIHKQQTKKPGNWPWP